MRTVIVGAGAVGAYLAERLSVEGHDVVVIEADAARADEVQSQVDCLVIHANGASHTVLEQAGVADAALLIAVSSSDAVNILASEVGKRLDVGKVVARVEDPALREHLDMVGIDVVIDPVEALSRELLLLVGKGGVSEVMEFGSGRISLVGGYVQPDAPLDGITLRELRSRVKGWDWIVAAVVRNGDTFIARGNSDIHAGDHVIVVASGKHTGEAIHLMGLEEHRATKVVVLGASRLARITADLLASQGIHTLLIAEEVDERAETPTSHDRLVVVKGDPTDPKLLESEGVGNADMVLALTGWDHMNILGCLVAKALGTTTAVARFHRFEYVALLAGHGIDAGVSTRLAAANAILRLVRRGTIHSVATFQDSDAEAIELQATATSESVGRTLTEIGLPRSTIVGGIVRGRKAFVPHGDTVIEAGDTLIVIALPDAIPFVEKLFS